MSIVWGGFRELPLSRVDLPGGIKARQKLPHVIELAASIKANGQEAIHPPTIFQGKLVAGRDRMAAMMLLGMRRMWFHVVASASKAELLALEVDENLHRRQDNRDALIARKVATTAKEVDSRRTELYHLLPVNSPRQKGRPKTTAVEAREKVAAQLGVTPEAIRRAEVRAREDEAGGQTTPAEVANPSAAGVHLSLPPPVETYDLPLLTEAEMAEVRVVQDVVDLVDAALRKAQGALAPIEKLAFGSGIHQRLARELHAMAVTVRGLKPWAACAFCKRIPARMATCLACGGIGLYGTGRTADVPAELKRCGAEAVVTDGRGGFLQYALAKLAVGGMVERAKFIANKSATVVPLLSSASMKKKRNKIIDAETGQELLPAEEVNGTPVGPDDVPPPDDEVAW